MKIEKIKLYDENDFEKKNDVLPYMDLYTLKGEQYDNQPTERPKRPIVLICPGGGYSFLSEREAEPVATKYLSRGYNVGVVYYSVEPYCYPQALLDLSHAILYVREHADEYHIDENKIAVCGFSAGGHLAASLSTMWNEPFLAEKLGVKNEMLKPNLSLLCYPVIASGKYEHSGSFDVLAKDDKELRKFLSLENHVTDKTPPAYIWHTAPDTTVPVMNSLIYAEKLSQYNVPFEMHIYPKCDHGMSLANAETCTGYENLIDDYISSWILDTFRFMELMFEK